MGLMGFQKKSSKFLDDLGMPHPLKSLGGQNGTSAYYPTKTVRNFRSSMMSCWESMILLRLAKEMSISESINPGLSNLDYQLGGLPPT